MFLFLSYLRESFFFILLLLLLLLFTLLNGILWTLLSFNSSAVVLLLSRLCHLFSKRDSLGFFWDALEICTHRRRSWPYQLNNFRFLGGILFGIHIQVLWHINNINGCDSETTGTSVYYTPSSSSSFEYYCSPLPLFACHVSVGGWRGGGVSTRNKNKHLFIYLFIYYFLIMKEIGCWNEFWKMAASKNDAGTRRSVAKNRPASSNRKYYWKILKNV